VSELPPTSPSAAEDPPSGSPSTPMLFVSYDTDDAAYAAELGGILAEDGYRTWIAPDDIRGSRPWAEQILEAIAAATMMVVLVSSDANQSSHVGREVNLALDQGKPILPIRIEEVALSGTLHYLLALVQWVDAFPPPLRRHRDRLSRRIADLLGDGAKRPTPLPREDRPVGLASRLPRVAAAPCLSCGAENRDGAQFCDACGGRLSEVSPPTEVRKTVTIVFCDVAGSTALGESLDPEILRRIMSRYFDTMTEGIERHNGTLEKFIGDAVMAVFGLPTAHEDDALRAVRAAGDMREALALLNKELERDYGATLTCRIGVNTGEVVAETAVARQALITGDAVNVAAQIEQAAPPGEVLMSGSTLRLVRDAVVSEPVAPLDLKGKTYPIEAHRLVAVHHGAAGVARRLDSPLVGRQRQLGQLSQAFEEAVADRVCYLFTILGPPGVGKSRLVKEFIESISDRASILSGRCLSYGEGITYWPLAEMVRDAVGPTEIGADLAAAIAALLPADPSAAEVAARVAQLAGGSSGVSIPADEIGWAVRRFLEGLARVRPLVVVIDDLHWAEPGFLDLVDQVSSWSREAPILLLCMARPELLDARPEWGGGKLHASTAALEPLSRAESELLVANLLGEAILDHQASEAILGPAEGNPLFVEETIGMLVDDGLIRQEDGRWVVMGNLTDLTVPPTISALLSARIDRLDDGARAVMGRASVVGQMFYMEAVRDLSPQSEQVAVAGHISHLVRLDLVRPDISDLPGEDAFRFRHILLRDAAYQMLPRQTRADLHERFAAWLLTRSLLADTAEFVGYHLEQAYTYLSGLGPEDARARALADQASELLGTAAIKARDRSDWTGAEKLGRRAVALRRPDDPRRAWDLIELGHTYVDAERFSEAAAPFAEALELARRARDDRAEAHASLGQASISMMLDYAGGSEMVRTLVDDLISRFEEWADHRGLAFAHWWRAEGHWVAGQFKLYRDQLSHALRHAEAAGDETLVRLVVRSRVKATGLGASTVEELRADATDLEARASAYPTLRPTALLAHGSAAAMAGFRQEARALRIESRDLFTELVGEPPIAYQEYSWQIEMLSGDYVAAEQEIRRGYERVAATGAAHHRSTFAGAWAVTQFHLGRFDDARRLAAECRETSALDDAYSQMLWRGVEAKLAARDGSFELAERLGREGVEWAEGTDMLLQHAESFADLAEVYRLAGRMDDSRQALATAIDRASAKGATAVVDRLHRRLVDVAVD
jgi:class 3 adenylate cyclase/tetratricopeptide (TPR) repeat protein